MAELINCVVPKVDFSVFSAAVEFWIFIYYVQFETVFFYEFGHFVPNMGA